MTLFILGQSLIRSAQGFKNMGPLVDRLTIAGIDGDRFLKQLVGLRELPLAAGGDSHVVQGIGPPALELQDVLEGGDRFGVSAGIEQGFAVIVEILGAGLLLDADFVFPDRLGQSTELGQGVGQAAAQEMIPGFFEQPLVVLFA
jgi:hypothetical protein